MAADTVIAAEPGTDTGVALLPIRAQDMGSAAELEQAAASMAERLPADSMAAWAAASMAVVAEASTLEAVTGK
jgi:hypothetical protein